MKNRIVALAIAVCLICTVSPISAFAANVSGGSASTSLSYTVDNYYSIVIPSTIDLNSQTSFQITGRGCRSERKVVNC